MSVFSTFLPFHAAPKRDLPRCSRTPDGGISIVLPETVSGPQTWIVPADDARTMIQALVGAPEGQSSGLRNLLIVEYGAECRRLTAVMRSEEAAADAVKEIGAGLGSAAGGSVERRPENASRLSRLRRVLTTMAAGALVVLIGMGLIGLHSSKPTSGTSVDGVMPTGPMQGPGGYPIPALPGALPGTSLPGMPQAITVGPAASGMPGQAQPTAAPTIDQEGLATLKRIRDKQGIALAPIGPGSRVLYIFADPNCPHCRSLELALPQLPSNVVPVIMPVAFFSGSDIATSQVMCSKDRVAAWKSVIDGTAPKDAHACEAGTHTVKINSDLFTGVGFNSTPTIIADNGRILIGEASRDELMALLN